MTRTVKTFFRLVAGTLFLILALPVAQAHAAGGFVASEPRPKQELSQPPGWVTLAFPHELDAGVAKLVVTNSKGEPVTKDAPIVEGTNITMQLDDGLPKDTYTVHYRVNAKDGSLVGGTFQFAYGKGRWTQAASSSWEGSEEQPPILSDTDPWGRPEGNPTGKPLPDVVVEQSDGPTIEVVEPTPEETPSPEATAAEESTAPVVEEEDSGGMHPGVVAVIAVVVAAGVAVPLYFWRRGKS